MQTLAPLSPKKAPHWRLIQKENFTKLEFLADYLELSLDVRKKILEKPSFPLNIPRRLSAKIEKNTLNDPILRQFIPLEEEALSVPGFIADPVQDQTFRKTKKILHKYQGRALLITTSACAMHCRFCFRQNFPYETKLKDFEEEIDYIRKNSSLSEIILSGGDPLSLSDEILQELLVELNAIPHLRRIRFHTRFPIGIPERIDEAFLHLLSSSKKQIFFVIHCNHPKELDQDVIEALRKIHQLGIPVLNQSVLLKGVNDREATLLELSETLVNAGIIPYYLHQLDPVAGAAHFSLPPSRGPELICHLKKHMSGYGVPLLVKEEPGHFSKTWIV